MSRRELKEIDEEMEERIDITTKRFHCARSCCIALCVIIFLASLTIFMLTADAIIKFSYVTSLLGSNVFIYGVVVLLFVSFFSLLISPPMLYSLLIHNQSLLTMLSFSTLSIGSMGILAAALGFCVQAELNSGTLHSWMSEGLRREYGHPQDYAVTHAWDRLQSEMRCCGVDGDTEWISSDWYLGQVKYPRRRRPGSCCKKCSAAHEKICKFQIIEITTYAERRACELLANLCPNLDSADVDEKVCTGDSLGPAEMPVDAFVNGEGCFPVLEQRLRFYVIVLVSSGFLLAILLFSQTISAFVLNYSTDPLILMYDAVNTS
ncbi:hypothetical protein PFISCL1PPCAC_26699 [Pristionchus fissidentatus]|uniref:Uncharacterized protein n=1 Tax=Pristionchus fissidentatus TaxID=1538716 RepID=A0AAV5WWJ3_9BILA|nr:hypothetical protein PFISCL1PPCAC_26699 [Pristionchus fissidentatus]